LKGAYEIERNISRGTERASELYGDNTAMRAMVASVPFIGGGLDVIFTVDGQRAFKKRVQTLIEDMKTRIEQHDEEAINKEYLESEEFIDLVIKAFDSATRTRDEEKIRWYARVLTESTVRNKQEKYLPEEYLNVLASLTPKQVEVAWAMYEVQREPREGAHPEGWEGWSKEREEVRRKLSLEESQLIFMLKSLVAVGLVAEILRNKPGTIAIEYSITPSFKEMMNFLDVSQ